MTDVRPPREVTITEIEDVTVSDLLAELDMRIEKGTMLQDESWAIVVELRKRLGKARE